MWEHPWASGPSSVCWPRRAPLEEEGHLVGSPFVFAKKTHQGLYWLNSGKLDDKQLGYQKKKDRMKDKRLYSHFSLESTKVEDHLRSPSILHEHTSALQKFASSAHSLNVHNSSSCIVFSSL
jgi:hypothetical protein